MKSLDHYLRQPHLPGCTCSVCWVKIEAAKATPVPPIPCDQCRPSSALKVNGLWQVAPAFKCSKHLPSSRPPRYWYCIQNIGKPVPFVPIYEPFDLVG
ncbi:DUF5447 family protein [Pseudomonas sp. 5P_3.1_Bac2]|uniref:DUF5447 family protein n=1 Tax=Pseudomonas sp. 5P_3.1_Bac2 TaxID=2971617 RepID=UPI0021C9CD1D|nr:DUF5447 family protein [Pseudomonas sp. 5P_3.1_Bac2]MCU1717697.1 DUF5447 family protein [Pseudomonas sp. 5P_3.1_Bac2]